MYKYPTTSPREAPRSVTIALIVVNIHCFPVRIHATGLNFTEHTRIFRRELLPYFCVNLAFFFAIWDVLAIPRPSANPESLGDFILGTNFGWRCGRIPLAASISSVRRTLVNLAAWKTTVKQCLHLTNPPALMSIVMMLGEHYIVGGAGSKRGRQISEPCLCV